mgnify:CR=1 FL=1
MKKTFITALAVAAIIAGGGAVLAHGTGHDQSDQDQRADQYSPGQGRTTGQGGPTPRRGMMGPQGTGPQHMMAPQGTGPHRDGTGSRGTMPRHQDNFQGRNGRMDR